MAAKYTPDDIIKLEEYISTSTEEGYHSHPQVIIYIQNSRNGHDISSIWNAENEVLCERNTVFKVLKKVKMDLPKPIVIGKFEMTEEERKKVDEDFEIIIQNLQKKDKGVMFD